MLFRSYTNQRPVSADVPFIFSFAYPGGGNFGSATTYLNGVGDTGGFGGALNINPAYIGIGMFRGVYQGAYTWQGKVAEVITYNTAHDSSTRQGIEKYLSNKYGISVT